MLLVHRPPTAAPTACAREKGAASVSGGLGRTGDARSGRGFVWLCGSGDAEVTFASGGVSTSSSRLVFKMARSSLKLISVKRVRRLRRGTPRRRT